MPSRRCPIHGRNAMTESSTSSAAFLASSSSWALARLEDIKKVYGEDQKPVVLHDNRESKRHERIKQSIDGLLQQAKRVQDAPQIAGYIAGLLKTQGCDSTMYLYVKDAALAECRRILKEVVCYCKTDSSQRLRPSMALLGHLVKCSVIPAGPVIGLAESLLQEIDKPYRIECVTLLLVDTSSGVLIDRKYAYLLEQSLKEMSMRNREIVALGLHAPRGNI